MGPESYKYGTLYFQNGEKVLEFSEIQSITLEDDEAEQHLLSSGSASFNVRIKPMSRKRFVRKPQKFGYAKKAAKRMAINVKSYSYSELIRYII